MRWTLIILSYVFLALIALFWGPVGWGIDHEVFYLLRLPRVINAILVGGGLAVSGVLVQAMFSNPLADPFTTGVASAAALGATIGISLQSYFLWSPHITSFVFSIIFIAALFAVLRNNFHSQIDILLWGIISSLFMNALATTLRVVLFPTNWVADLGWLLGSLRMVSLQMAVIGLVCVTILSLIALCFWRTLDTISVHETSAESIGVPVDRFRALFFVLVSMITSICVMFGGIIGFVGLVIPHLARSLGFRSHRVLLVSSFLLGGISILSSDLISRVILQPSELPIGIVTSLLGAPVFLLILKKQYRSL